MKHERCPACGRDCAERPTKDGTGELATVPPPAQSASPDAVADGAACLGQCCMRENSSEAEAGPDGARDSRGFLGWLVWLLFTPIPPPFSVMRRGRRAKPVRCDSAKPDVTKDVETSAVEMDDPAPQPTEHLDRPSHFRAACASHSLQGERESNQDRACAFRLKLPGEIEIVFGAVADGMGGHEGGERAACLAIRGVVEEAVCQAVQSAGGLDGFCPEKALCAGFRRAQRYLANAARSFPDLMDMGATLTAGIALGRELHVASLGDTRLYLWSNGRLMQITRDDSVVQRLLDEGAIAPSEADDHPMANMVTRALCVEEDLAHFEVIRCGLLPGDVVVVSSDGFWKFAQELLPDVLAGLDYGDANESQLAVAAQTLAERALAKGSDDNISISLLWCGDSTVKPVPRRVTVESTHKEKTP